MSNDTPSQGRSPRDDLVAAAAALAPLLAENAARAERERRLPDENVRSLREAGFLRLWQPRRLGGLEADVRAYVEVITALARAGCGSSAWYGFILNGSAWIVGAMREVAQREVWASAPDALVCSQLQPAGVAADAPDGISLSGRWNFASGCHHADWSLVGFPILGDGRPVDQGLALIPLRECRIEESWFVCGMAATASDTVVAEDLRVPEHRIVRVSTLAAQQYPTEWKEETLYRTPFAPLGTIMVAPVIVGLARAALEATLRELERAPKRIAYTVVADTRRSAITQQSLARASALVDSAFLQLHAAADALDEAARAGDPMTRESRSFQRMRLAQAMRNSRAAVDLLLDVQGASGFALANPLQRIWRDLNVAARHGFVHPENNLGVYGRAIAGVEETVTPLA